MSEIHGAVGSYVINALDPGELDEFEAHLAVCPTCRREVVEFGETAAELSRLAPIHSGPPPELRGSILSAISGVRVLPPEPESSTPLSEAAAPVVHPGGDRDARGGTQSQPVESFQAPAADELAVLRQRRRTRVLAGLVAAALVLALGLGGVVIQLVQARQADVADQAAQTELYSAPDVRIYPVPLSNGGRASFVVSRSLGRALFVSRDLPTTSPRQTYQLWTLRDSSITATNPVGASPDVLVAGGGDRRAFIQGPLDGVTGLAVSIEDADGAQLPTIKAVQAVAPL